MNEPVGLEVDVQGRVGTLQLRAAFATSSGSLVLVGPNGSGKTSLLLTILGVIGPQAGRVALAGTVLFDSARGTDLPTEERGLGYVPQDYGLFPHMTVRENVEFAVGCRNPGADRRARRERAMELLEDLGIREHWAKRPSTLSGGERQRLALARALAARPRALLLDEPLAALDASARRAVRVFLGATLAKLGLPAVIVTHDPRDAVALGERIAVLESGQLVQIGTLPELQARPASAFVGEFVAGAVPPTVP